MAGRRIVVSLSVAAVLLLALVGSLAQAQGVTEQSEPLAALGTAFTYQGHLQQGGAPVTAVCDFRFTLWDAGSAGTQIGATQDAPAVAVSAGTFTIPSLDFGEAAFKGDARWLAIAVRCPAGDGSYTGLTPRQALTAVPYALYARSAPWSRLSGVPAGFVDGVDNDVLGGLACMNGQAAKWNGMAWICAADNDTAQTAGPGLTLTGNQFSVNTTIIQARITGACAAGQAMQVINADGTVGCVPIGGGPAGAWLLTGNGGTNPAANFLGTTDNQALELRVNGQRALRLQPDARSPSLIGGYKGNSVGPGVAGATIGGGGVGLGENQVTADYGTIGGGIHNSVSGSEATVSGGSYNTASGGTATIGGGGANQASGNAATIAGGAGNSASGDRATIGGGEAISVTGKAATVAGGSWITVTGAFGSVGGGRDNLATDNGATIGGGWKNRAGDGNEPENAVYATVGGGSENVASAMHATIGGGQGNAASGVIATIGGGYANKANDWGATVGGGDFNVAGSSATVAGGFGNRATAVYATICGGTANLASGANAVVPGGNSNAAEGNSSLAAGYRAKAKHQGAFVWADFADADFASTANNQFAVRATGGVRLETGGAGVKIDGNTTWHAGNDGTGSGLDADLLDGQHAAAFAPVAHAHNAADITAGALDHARFSAYADLGVEGYLDNTADSDLLTRNQADGRYVNEGQADSVTSGMVANGTLMFADIGQNGCASGQVMQWNGTVWACATVDGGSYWSLTGNASTNPATNFLGTTDNQAVELKVNGQRALRLAPNGANAPNVVAGSDSNSVTAGVYGATIGGGGVAGLPAMGNQVGGNYGTVGGGRANVVNGDSAVVAGGFGSQAGGAQATVGGGFANQAGGTQATVSGGSGNNASAAYSTIGGGRLNTATAITATIGGGEYITVSGAAATVAGGSWITVTSPYAAVGGGQFNATSGNFAVVAGGTQNTATGNKSVIGGGHGNQTQQEFGVIGGGAFNVTGDRATVSGGTQNQATAQHATVSGGYANTASGNYATVSGGTQNQASGEYNTTGGGYANIASGGYATVGGGQQNQSSGQRAVVGGGQNNTASEFYSTVPGGFWAQASHYGQMAYASGKFEKAGDAQASLYVLRAETISGNLEELFLNQLTQRITLASGQTVGFEITVVARSGIAGQPNGQSAIFYLQGGAKNVNGTVTLIGVASPKDIPAVVTENASWKTQVEADNAHSAVVIKVRGTSGVGIRWVATIRTTEVSW